MADRTIRVYAKCLTLGEHLLYDLSNRLGCESWLGHSDGGEAAFTEAVVNVHGRPVRFQLQIGGQALPGSLELKDERNHCVLVSHDAADTRYGVVPPDQALVEFLVEAASARDARGAAPSGSFAMPFVPHPLQV